VAETEQLSGCLIDQDNLRFLVGGNDTIGHVIEDRRQPGLSSDGFERGP
jgi:hypothetical protein